MNAPWFYFGCVREAGHYLFDRNGNKARGYGGPEQYHLREALSHFDSVLPPPRGDGLYRASFSTLGGLGYCALSWWDGSVDKRPGSNSTVFAPGLIWTPERLLEIYPKAFPWLAERQPQPVTLWAPAA
jgi:hypothetical protein